MPNNHRPPEMWTLESTASVIATGAIAALFAGFFVVCLLRGLGLQALGFTGGGAALMAAYALGQWRAVQRRSHH